MKNVLLIGLGRFGRHMAMDLNRLDHQVMAVDLNEERINDILPYVTNAQIGDSTNEQFIRSLGVNNYDLCIVAIGKAHLKLHRCSKSSVLKKSYPVPNGMFRRNFFSETEPIT